MADEEPATTGNAPSDADRSPLVFVSDASAETERLGDTIRAAGYRVADVELGTLLARVVEQPPHVVLLDIDGEGALELVAQVRKVPGTGSIDFVYLGSGEGIVKGAEDAIMRDGSAFFRRPVDVGGLVRKIEALTGGPGVRPEVRPSTPPPSLPARPFIAPSMRDSPPSSDEVSRPSLPSPGARMPGPPLPMSTRSLADFVAPRPLAAFGTVSHELQRLLADAEMDAEAPPSEAAVPTPDEEIDAVLPADVLASLDEPIEGDEGSDDNVGRERTNHGYERDPHATAKGTTASAYRRPTTGSSPPARGSSAPSLGRPRTMESVAPASLDLPTLPPLRDVGPGGAGSFEPKEATRNDAERPIELAHPPRSRNDDSVLPRAAFDEGAPSSWHPPPLTSPARLKALALSIPLPAVTVLVGSDSARRFFADAIVARATGALCFESDGVVRRVVLREGDFVAAASSDESETLVSFLTARGELSREEAPRLARKVPPYGRHAGAALVAQGWLRQDQLWTVLRAHAEWIASRILRLSRGSAQLEHDPPGRLRGEPGVFGAATGASIFVELVRRTVPWEETLEALGGESTRIAEGSNHRLLAECNLAPHELELLRRASGGTVKDLLARANDGEILAVVHALALLGVVEPVLAPDFGRREGGSASEAKLAEIDEDAVRSRVRARLELVEEGDYFAVLGIARDATGYEVRRAFLELRRAFEPSRVLNPRLLDLADDVRKIVTVVEEAYEILRDRPRRERYRRAIEMRPE